MIGRIYQITTSKNPNLSYIGSTIRTLGRRWYQHKKWYQSWLKTSKGSGSLFPHIQEYGIESFEIKLIKEYTVVDKKHLYALEQLWINKNRGSSINKICAFQCLPKQRNKEQSKGYREANKEKYKEYCQANKEKISERLKKYRQHNKEKIKEYKKEHRQTNKEKYDEYQLANKEKIAKQRKEYRQANKEKIKKYRQDNKDKIAENARKNIECECGAIYQHLGKSRHLKTKKHTNWLAENQ